MGMSKLQRHFFEMLCNIDDACKKHGIQYSLAEHSAWDAVKFGGYHGGMYDTAIMITVDSLPRFEEAVSQAGMMVVEDGVGADKGMTKRCIDPSSTLYDILNPKRFRLGCVGVDVRVLKQGAGERFETVNPKGGIIKLPASLFDEFAEKELEGRAFPIVADFDAYFKVLVREDWEKKNWNFPIPKEPSPPYNLIYSATLPFDSFIKRPLARKSTNMFHTAKRGAYSWWRKKYYDRAIKASERGEVYLSLTEDRFVCWEHYYPQKQEILELAKLDPLGAELEERMGLMLETMKKYQKKSIGFTIDEDLLDVALPFLKRDKGEDYVKSLLDKIPTHQRAESIEQLLRGKGVQHPLFEMEEEHSGSCFDSMTKS